MLVNDQLRGAKEGGIYCNGIKPQDHPGQLPLSPTQSFVLYLDNCAPVVNTLNFGFSSPVLLNPPHLQLAQIKTQLTLHHFTSGTSNNIPPVYSLLNQALLKISTAHTMFPPRGGFPGQRPQGLPRMMQPHMGPSGMNRPGMNQHGMNLPGMNNPSMGPARMNHPGIGMDQPRMNFPRMNHPGMNQSGLGFHPEMKSPGMGMRPHAMDPSGSFMGGSPDPIGMKGMPMRPSMIGTPERVMGPQGFQPRFMGSSPILRSGQPRMQELPPGMNMLGKPHPQNLRIGKDAMPLQGPGHPLGSFGNTAEGIGVKSVNSPQVALRSDRQARYTSESASSILKSFGLSNEDLEELSRYPDNQLTPENMPVILREIRLRKMGHSVSTVDQGSGRRPVNELLPPSKVIDYGHSSKYPITDDPVSMRVSEFSRIEEKPRRTSAKLDTQKSDLSKKATVTPKREPETSNKSVESANKIPTISNARKNKPVQQPSKTEKPNNIVVGEQTSDKPEVPGAVKPNAGGVQPVTTTVSHSEVKSSCPDPQITKPSDSQVGTVANQENTASEASAWLKSENADVLKTKKQPTPSMMNDYYAASPRIFPHICSLCNIECSHLKDWITHQNTTTHIESCRKLRQQYPDWNPQDFSLRNDGKKKDEISRTRSKSKSPISRRPRRSGSRHRTRRSRSRSPRGSRRIRSPRRSRSSQRTRSRSPRRPYRSLRRSASPRRRSRSPRRSSTPRRSRNARRSRTRSNSPSNKDKKAVDAAVKNFIEASKKSVKVSSNEKKVPPNSTTVKTKQASSTAPPKKSISGSSTDRKSSSASASQKSSTVKRPSTSSSSRRPSTSSSSFRRPTTTALRKTVGYPKKAAGKKNYPVHKKEPPAPKGPLDKLRRKFSQGTIIHATNLPDSGYTDQDLVKIVQPFGKVSDVLIIQSKNEAYIETNFKEAATAAVKFSETTAVMIQSKQITLCLAGQKKAPEASQIKENKASEMKTQIKKVPQEEVPKGFVRRYRLTAPQMKDSEKCVILVSNLPDADYTLDEITNLAKPFGGVIDVLLFSTHKKAYLELTNSNSVDSMIKFYTIFPTYLHGSLLSIIVASKFKNVKDEYRIFVDLIEETQFKITPPIYGNFVCLENLPEKGYKEFEVVCVGLRFGRVEHYAIISNKRKAILNMCTANAAKAMRNFLSQFPCSIGDNVVQCPIPSKIRLSEEEYETFLEKQETSVKKETKAEESKMVVQASSENTVKVEVSTKMDSAAVIPSGSTLAVACSDEDEPMAIVSSNKQDSEKILEPEVQEPLTIVEDGKEEDLIVDAAQIEPVIDREPLSDLSPQAADEDDEEAAEAPEATSFYSDPVSCVPASEVISEYRPQPPTAEELEVLVSVESECEDEASDTEPEAHKCSKESNCEVSAFDEISKEENLGAEISKDSCSEDHKDVLLEDSATEMTIVEDPKVSETDADKALVKCADSDVKEEGDAAKEILPSELNASSTSPALSPTSLTRTAKYNPLKGELSVTLTLDSQNTKIETRKKSLGDKKSGKESDTPKSNSNRSSPSDSISSQKRGGGRSVSQEKDAKVTSKSREREIRSNTKKDDRSKDQEGFSFNLDEFVTVDEIAEEHTDTKNAKEKAKTSQTPTTNKKRKDYEQSSEGKKSKERTAASLGDKQELSFVTLDEVGSEDVTAGTEPGDSLVVKKSVSQTGKGQSKSAAKNSQVLMTLDEISDEEDMIQDAKSVVTKMPEDFTKEEQLVTLDEVSEEEPTSNSDVSNSVHSSIQGTEHTDTKVANEAPTNKLVVDHVQVDPSDQPLLTLDEIKGDDGDEDISDDNDSIADIVAFDEGHHFFTVDEIGEEEEDNLMTSETNVESQKPTGKKSIAEKSTVTPRRGRPRKRPFPNEPDPSSSGRKMKKEEDKADQSYTENSTRKDAVKKPKGSKAKSPEKSKLAPFNPNVTVGMDFLVPKTGFFCKLCSLFYMDDASKIKHCKSVRHYQAVETHMAKESESQGKEFTN
ncbi:zinc finger protein 638 isoform X2 [Bombina bombina]|uniref:zinc finger protein 638 isoform X2 n=1 Tax=Bombina bombina TaxID=8345 RepID=UPI00235AD205|nr:zinc finger protein 638 isoform X2 [Bombina bombina]